MEYNEIAKYDLYSFIRNHGENIQIEFKVIPLVRSVYKIKIISVELFNFNLY